MKLNDLISRLHLPADRKMPAFDGANEWLNTEPLTPSDLHGKVVAVDFWTYTCINWLRTLPYIRAWADAYAAKGLVVIGVHTPEFTVEHDIDNVRGAVRDMGIEYPVAIDNDYAVWNAFANQYWPALYIADAEGRIRQHQFGEGGYEMSERAIRQLLADAGAVDLPDDPVPVEARGIEIPGDWDTCDRRRRTSASRVAKGSRRPAGPRSTSRVSTPCRHACTSTSGRSRATGRWGAKKQSATRRTAASPTASTRVTCTSSSRRRPSRPRRDSASCSMGKRPVTRTASTSTRPATALSPNRGSTNSFGNAATSPTGSSRSSSSIPAPPLCASRLVDIEWRVGDEHRDLVGSSGALHHRTSRRVPITASTGSIMTTTVDTADDIRPFHVDTPEKALEDLRGRIAGTNWPEKETVGDQSQGVPLAMIQKLARYWMTDYDWRTCEANLNALPQFITQIDGLDIHFIHVRSRHEDALPLIVNHGWPGSIIEQLKIIDRLTDPTAHGASAADAFHVVIPSMPGYGFSGKPTSTGWGPRAHGPGVGGTDAAPRL